MSVSEIDFAGQCEVFVCLDLVHFFFSLRREACRYESGMSMFKKMLIFPTPIPFTLRCHHFYSFMKHLGLYIGLCYVDFG